MEKPNFKANDEVKVINKESSFYGKRGKVVRVVGLDLYGYEAPQPYSPDTFPRNWMVDVCIDGEDYSFFDWQEQLELVKHAKCIEN